MAIISKGTTYSAGDQVTHTNLNALVDSATFDTPADGVSIEVSGGVLQLRDGGTSPAKLSTGAPTWDNSGNQTITGLIDISGASAGQIKFPATQNASSNVNTLDDYEEGTWTPSLGGTATYGSQSGTYTKIGKVVYISCFLSVSLIGTGSTYVISGLPFTASGVASFAVSEWTSAAGSFVYVGANVNSATISLTASTAATASLNTSPAFFGNGAQIKLSGFYFV